MKQEMKMEAISRLERLVKKYELNPNLLKYFEEDRLYYSYLTAGGLLASIDTISYDPINAKAVQDFEKETGYMVYHAIESNTPFGRTLSLLYVSNDKRLWKGERLYKDYIRTYTVNFDYPECSEFGDIIVGGLIGSGALLRYAY